MFKHKNCRSRNFAKNKTQVYNKCFKDRLRAIENLLKPSETPKSQKQPKSAYKNNKFLKRSIRPLIEQALDN